MNDRHAVVVLPPGAFEQQVGREQRGWLSRGLVSCANPGAEVLHNVLHCIAVPPPACGLAALRFLGQTGEAPAGWMAAADPVHFEARLRHLVVHSLEPGEVSAEELRDLFGTLQQQLAGAGESRFVSIGSCGYLRGGLPLATPTLSASSANGRLPDEFTPGGDTTRAFHKLQGEVQMVLHDHPVNLRRADAGRPTINALWFWGGGRVSEVSAQSLPVLFADDPLLVGYWSSHSASVEAGRGDIDSCIECSASGFVAVLPGAVTGISINVADTLERLRRGLQSGAIGRLSLLFHDGLRVDLTRRDLLKFWKRPSAFLMTRHVNE